jgi:4-hydroxybenzoate polyprenyltransferase
LLPGKFMLLIAAYLALTSSYSLSLKRVPILDIIVLAGLYALRVFAGAVGTNTPASPWLLTFSLFMFLSLACAKRFSELDRCGVELNAEETPGGKVSGVVPGRGYLVTDKAMIGQSGISAGFGAVLVMALYINSSAVRVLYSKPEVLWLLGPLVLYWVLRVWFIAHRGQLNEDPIVFALKDKTSYVIAGLSLLVLTSAV